MAANNVANVVEYYAGMDVTFPFGNDDAQLDLHNDSVNFFNTIVANKIFTPDNGESPEDLQLRVSKKLKFFIGSNDEANNTDYSFAISDDDTKCIITSERSNLSFDARETMELKSFIVEEPADEDVAKLSMDKHLLIQSKKHLKFGGNTEFTEDVNIEKNLYVGKSLIFQEATQSNDQVRIGMQYNQTLDCLDVIKHQGLGAEAKKKLMARFGRGAVMNANDTELAPIPYYRANSASYGNSNETSEAPLYPVANTWNVTGNGETLYYGARGGENVGIGLSNITGVDSKLKVKGDSKINSITLDDQNSISGADKITADRLHVRSFESTQGFSITSPVEMEDVKFKSLTFKNIPAGSLTARTLPTETFAVPYNDNPSYWDSTYGAGMSPMHITIRSGSVYNPDGATMVNGYSRSAIFTTNPFDRNTILETDFSNSGSTITLPSDFNALSKFTASITGYYEGYGADNYGTPNYFPLQVVAVVGGTLTTYGEWDTLPSKMAMIDFNPHPSSAWPSDAQDLISGVSVLTGTTPGQNMLIFDNVTLSTTSMTSGTFEAGDVVQFLIGVPKGEIFRRVFDGPGTLDNYNWQANGVSFSMNVSLEYTEGSDFDGRLSKLNNDIFPLDPIQGNNKLSMFSNDSRYISNYHEVPVKNGGRWRFKEHGEDLIVEKWTNLGWTEMFKFED